MSLALFDVDGPLVFDRAPEFFTWANQQPDVETQWSYSRFVETGDWVVATGGLKPKQTNPLYRRFTLSEDCPDMKATPGASNALKQLWQLTKHIATARTKTLRQETTLFLQAQVSDFAEYHFEVHWEKAALARDLNAQFIIDDNHHLLRSVASSTVTKPILFPSRAHRKLDDLGRVIVLEAESYVADDMSPDEFSDVCSLAWQEITDILNSNNHKCFS